MYIINHTFTTDFLSVLIGVHDPVELSDAAERYFIKTTDYLHILFFSAIILSSEIIVSVKKMKPNKQTMKKWIVIKP